MSHNRISGRLTGKQQFLQKKAGDEVMSETIGSNQVQVDESLFDADELDDLGNILLLYSITYKAICSP